MFYTDVGHRSSSSQPSIIIVLVSLMVRFKPPTREQYNILIMWSFY